MFAAAGVVGVGGELAPSRDRCELPTLTLIAVCIFLGQVLGQAKPRLAPPNLLIRLCQLRRKAPVRRDLRRIKELR